MAKEPKPEQSVPEQQPAADAVSDLQQQPEEEQRKFIKKGALLAHKLRTKDLFLPERNEWIRIREIALADFDVIDFQSMDEDGNRIPNNFRARLIRYGVIDEAGNPLFDDSDLSAINSLPSRMANRIVEAITGLSALDKTGLERELKN